MISAKQMDKIRRAVGSEGGLSFSFLMTYSSFLMISMISKGGLSFFLLLFYDK